MSPATIRWVAFSILVALSLPARAAEPKVDFNGDGRADVFLRNLFTGSVSAWLINGSRVLQTASYGTVAPTTGWAPIGLDDFNGDGRADIFWFNVHSGSLSAWLLDGSRVLQTASYGAVAPTTGWTPVSLNDFNGDGRTDIFWYNAYTGGIAAWLINGSRVLQTASYGTVAPTTGWVPIGFDDFNGDGRTDVFWYNAYTGGIAAWLIDGGRVLQTASYGTVAPNSGWLPIGLDDFNGDGRADVFWYNAYTGNLSAWFLDGSRVLQTASYGTVTRNSGWIPVGFNDFNGDGRTDIFWYNAYTGGIAAWLIDGGRVLQTASYGTVAPTTGWAPIGLDDFNGDGRADVFWFKSFENTTSVWFLDGGRVLQTVSYGNVPPSSVWQVQIPR